MVNGFKGKSQRIVMFLLLHAGQLVSQKQIVEQTKLSKGLVSRVVNWLSANGAVKRPYRTRVVLEYPQKLLADWSGQREIALKKAYFAKDEGILKKVKHCHTLLSGAWLDCGYLRSGFTTVFVEPNFVPPAPMKLVEGKVGQLKSKVVLIPAEDEFVFYGKRSVNNEKIVNPFLLYADLASFGGICLTALQQVAEKHGFAQLIEARK
ncbi:MarR family transcriptional regulator [Candidatus Micrarchaeota archaeon]|nr:MarR family transcriptional regulator [Candidatus Micrarchaeota archaeon]